MFVDSTPCLKMEVIIGSLKTVALDPSAGSGALVLEGTRLNGCPYLSICNQSPPCQVKMSTYMLLR